MDHNGNHFEGHIIISQPFEELIIISQPFEEHIIISQPFEEHFEGARFVCLTSLVPQKYNPHFFLSEYLYRYFLMTARKAITIFSQYFYSY